MRIAMIAAMAQDRVIGLDNKMPWHLPEELQYFKAVTMGKPILMGRNTYESIGRPLPGRQNIVISRNETLVIAGVDVVHTIEQAIAIAGDCEELMVIGGAHLYQQMLSQADVLYLTELDLSVAGDAFFPDYTKYDWDKSESKNNHSKNGINFVTYTLTRR
ncbi:MAG: type 3 dihydrofolate reductase [Gammaproteobacteria bacterium]|nr:type 3 dihydrofolate reductase [Gammaproteobacteria bacterium]